MVQWIPRKGYIYIVATPASQASKKLFISSPDCNRPRQSVLGYERHKRMDATWIAHPTQLGQCA